MTQDFSVYQDDVFGHMLKTNIYTPLCYCFELECSAQTQRDIIISTLRKGLERLSATFPWLAGQVVRASDSENRSELPKIVPLEDVCRLIVQDVSNNTSIPSMSELKQAKFPCSMFDGEALTSLTGIPNSREGEPSSVFFAQINFLRDGMILSFAGEHSVLDGHATGQVIRLLDKACHYQLFTEEEITQGNQVRNSMIPLLDLGTYTPGPELDFLVEKSHGDSRAITDQSSSPSAWANVHFSASKLAKLKLMASTSSSLSVPSTASYTTTNDALTAFIWRHTSRARMRRLAPDTKSTIGRAVDVRSSLSISSCYLGNMSNHTYSTLSLSDIATMPLGVLASVLRQALDPGAVAYGMRSLATHLASVEDKDKIHYGANLNFTCDLFFSSWARLPCYQQDFNLGLNTPQAVRRPGFMSIEGLMYLMPMDNEKNIEAMLSLSSDDLAELKADAEFLTYADWVG